MKRKGSFLAGILTMLLIICLARTAAAVNATVRKELTYRDIKISLNGQEIVPKDANGNAVEPFIIDGTTYLPVRAVGDALGLNVGWDGATSTVILTTGEQQPSTPSVQPDTITTESALNALKEKLSNITDILIYNEATDPNGSLGRPGEYIGKGDFFDNRIENPNESAGTIEFFSTESDCEERYDYLCSFSDAGLGAFGLNQYVYKYKLAIFRVSYELTPSQAEEYKAIMDEIMGEVSTQYMG